MADHPETQVSDIRGFGPLVARGEGAC
jgi:hypothetical protein